MDDIRISGRLEITGGLSLNNNIDYADTYEGLTGSNVEFKITGGSGGIVSSERLIASTANLGEAVLTGPCVFREGFKVEGFGSFWDVKMVSDGGPPELAFVSRGGVTTTFSGDFEPGVLNFTGKHRCTHSMQTEGALPGMIVCATGEYRGLQGEEPISVDEAVPVVELSSAPRDPRAFGVIAGWEDPSDTVRKYKVGTMEFSYAKSVGAGSQKVIVNSVGEGGILVCDSNGPFKNGDLICSSDRRGYGMRQGDDVVRSCTVGKITCDCDFSDDGTAFVGCVYKF